jgi:hypothetical protein
VRNRLESGRTLGHLASDALSRGDDSLVTGMSAVAHGAMSAIGRDVIYVSLTQCGGDGPVALAHDVGTAPHVARR